MSKYDCKICEYTTSRKYDYTRHIKSKKHIKIYKYLSKSKHKDSLNGSKDSLNESKEYNICPTNIVETTKCIYCNKNIIYKKNINRHYSRCQRKIGIEYSLKKEQDIIKEKDNIIETLQQEKKQAEEDLMNLMRDVVKSKATITINNNTIKNKNDNNNHTINMLYIMKNYNDVEDYDTIMNEPASKEEKQRLLTLGADYAVEDLLKTRCITNIPANKRPIHCVDVSRDKFVVRRNNRWKIDNRGKMIMEGTFPIIREIFLQDSGKEICDMAKDGDMKGIDKLLHNQNIASNIVAHKKDKDIMETIKNNISTKNIS